LSSGGRFPRVILFAAVAAAVVAGTLPAVLKQATPAEDTTDRAALVAPANADPAPAPAAAVEPLFMPSPVKVALVTEILDAPARAGATASPPPEPVQAEIPPAAAIAAAPVPLSFPPVQPMDMDTADISVAPALRTLPPPDGTALAAVAPVSEAPNTTIMVPPPAATKNARRARVAYHRAARRRHVRPAPFSIRRLFATLRLR